MWSSSFRVKSYAVESVAADKLMDTEAEVVDGVGAAATFQQQVSPAEMMSRTEPRSLPAPTASLSPTWRNA